MANTKSAKKQIRVQAKKKLRNTAIKSKIKTIYKSAVTQIETKPNERQKAISVVFSELDKAAAKGVIHKNKAARKKSRLLKKNQQQGSPSEAVLTNSQKKNT